MNDITYTVQGPGRARADQFLLALGPGPDPSNVFTIKYKNVVKLYNYLYIKRYTYNLI
jgi:hypothetical protein